MDILQLRLYPDPILLQPAKPVTSFDTELKALAQRMFATMYHERGIGLAAPQIGVSSRIAVIDVQEEHAPPFVLVNPEIVARAGRVDSEEGCLSIPEYRDTILRDAQITVRFQNLEGEFEECEASEMLAMCLQHEIDHLDGILFVDRLSRLKRDFFRRWCKKQGIIPS